MSTEDLLTRRERIFGPNNPLFYDAPVHLVRGEGVWLYGADGERFLDCYNNVPCVGHSHPKVVQALSQQAATLNTHTRYLHDTILDYGELLLSKFSAPLNRLALCCTGSEANDLALRIAKLNTGGTGFICTNATYHGNTAAVAQLSSIFEPFEGYGAHVKMVPWPDSYRPRGDLTGDAVATSYAEDVKAAIDAFQAEGIAFAGLIACPIFANEGLTEIAPAYLREAIAHVHAAGGLFIADEVQSGFGRTGRWWGHEGSGVTPDILTLGKPMAAGYPVAGVVARGDLLDAFRAQDMYFNTFAGSPMASAVAKSVLEVLVEERLVENARDVGAYLHEAFTALKELYPVIGDVRGEGLFFGIELVEDPSSKAPAPKAARKLVNWMRHNGILMSKIGEHDNVLKLRPPLCFSKDNADLLLGKMKDALEAL